MVKGKKVKFFEGFEFDNWFEAIADTLIMVVVVGGVSFLVGWLLFNGEAQKYEYTDTVTYCVEQGDTLWTIASRYSDTERQDVRKVIDIIEEINDCDANIFPGDPLEIPVFSCLTQRQKK